MKKPDKRNVPESVPGTVDGTSRTVRTVWTVNVMELGTLEQVSRPWTQYEDPITATVSAQYIADSFAALGVIVELHVKARSVYVH